jgi:TPR repeat protein
VQNWPEAQHWYEQGAAKNNAMALANLGGMYARGNGVAQDRARAAELWQKAAKQGSADALASLGRMYEEDQNHAKAIEMYREAGRRKSVEAAFRLGEMYEQGIGVARSDAAAFGWYSMAQIYGHPEGATRRDAAARRLPPGEIDGMINRVTGCFYSKRCNF